MLHKNELSKKHDKSTCKQLVRAGHELAASMSSDMPISEIAKLVRRLATGLDVMSAMVQQVTRSAAITDIIEERQRQLVVKGFTLQQDDTYTAGELAAAAISYIEPMEAESYWPADWHDESFKPSDYRSNLVKAGALIAAEIERIDRAIFQQAQLSSSLSPLPVNRDEQGLWTHPEYSALFGDRDGVSETEFNAWCDARSVVSALSYLDSDDDNPVVRTEYFDNGNVEAIVRWNPKPPEGKGWFLGSIHDSEDGPVAVWFCNKSTSTPQEVSAIDCHYDNKLNHGASGNSSEVSRIGGK
ncbi:hypothetical protein [Enterobacter asburiae]|uniref:hypothetical protein n=1 Tax=Enterobacter asburiae TaxID=61645 RepID=UPI00168165AE|nr:hypothetical protein [Enterobacter asburiae]